MQRLGAVEQDESQQVSWLLRLIQLKARGADKDDDNRLLLGSRGTSGCRSCRPLGMAYAASPCTQSQLTMLLSATRCLLVPKAS